MRLLAGVALLMISLASTAQASDGAVFESQFSDAWTHCRDALYQSAPDYADREATAEALRAFAAAWTELTDRWAAKPPPQYSEDADFGQELKAIGELAMQARGQTRHGQLDQAHQTLAQIRALLAEMRRKNGVTRYTDQLDAFDEKLAETADDDLDQSDLTPTQFVELCEQVGVLGYLAERLQKRTPAALTTDDAFLDMVDGLARQVQGLKAAVLSGRRAPIEAALSDLRRSFDRIYLLYG